MDWITDPQGIAWETYHSLGSIPVFGEEAAGVGDKDGGPAACCAGAPDTDAQRPAQTRSGCCA
jgi:hypothetical protein